ncbi:MAG: carbohydrate ABC transporter permease [Holosporaceae bacterium]|jgi:trehalose/maltose transport system permease protein|nr:carbohydrate ABC transporter permease [Holosporaceae bacterium]
MWGIKIIEWKCKRFLKNAIFCCICLAVVLCCLFPFYWAVVSSLRGSTDLFSTELFPSRVTFENYIHVLNDVSFGYSFFNSVAVATLTSLVTLAVCLFAAYPLARQRFTGRKLVLMIALSVTTLPHVAVLSGMFEMIRIFDIYNEKSALVLAYMIITVPFTLWVMTNFMNSIPKDLEEAAVMDGAGNFTILIKIFFPILGPAVVTTGLLAFIAAWNEFLFALTFALDNQARTVPVSLALFSGATPHESPYGLIMAASVLVTLPLILLVIIFQRRIISGLTAGSVKG